MIVEMGLYMTTVMSAFTLALGSELTEHELKELDSEIAVVLMRPCTDDWHNMLNNMELYINKLNKTRDVLMKDCNSNKELASAILKKGFPNHVNLAIDENDLLEEAEIPKDQVQRFYQLRDRVRAAWERFYGACFKANVTYMPTCTN